MLKKALLASALSLALVTTAAPSFAASAPAAPTIAVINLPLIMSELPQVKAVEAKLSKEYGAREKEVSDMQQKGIKLQQDIQAGKFKGDELTKKQRELAQLQADFGLKARALQEDQKKSFMQEQQKIEVDVQKAINEIAKEKGYDIVLRGEGVVYATPAFDISNDVIKRASKQ